MKNQLVVDQYLEWAETRARLAPATLKAYKFALGQYLDWLGDRSITDVNFEDVEDFGSRPRRGGKLPSPAAARRDIVVVRGLHEWANERDMPVRRVSSAKAPKVAGRVPKPVEDDVWVALWTSDLSFDDRVWIGMGYFFGLRRVEIVTINAASVDIDKGEMSFVRKGGSTQPIEYREMIEVVADELPHVAIGWERFLEMFHTTVKARAHDEWLWTDASGHPDLDSNRLNKRLIRLENRLGLVRGSVTPHRLRHSCATNLLRAGVEPAFIMDALSHADLTTTMRYMKTSGQLARWRKARQ